MKKIGQGWQYTAYDLGNGRVLKKVNNRWQTFWQIFWYRFPCNIKRAYFGYDGIMELARNSLDFLEPYINDLKNVLGNPVINSDYSYEQDLVTPVFVYFKNHTYEENIKIIDQYINLIFLFWGYGFGERPFKLLLNYGVTNTGELVLFDLGELYFTKEKAIERIQSKHWYKTYFPENGELKAYYFKKMDEAMTVGNLEKYWLNSKYKNKMNRDEILAKEMQIAEEIFGTENDPDQIPITQESIAKLDRLCSGWLASELDENNEPISWAISMPTQKQLAQDFLDNKITEKQLLGLTLPANTYDAVYLVSVITVPQHRGKGLGAKVVKQALQNMPLTNDALCFVWPTSDDGMVLAKKIEKDLNRKIEFKK